MAEQVLSALRSESGRGVGEIAGELGVASADLRAPLQLLLEKGQIKKTGQKRGTKYHAGGKGGSRRKSARTRKTRARSKARTRTRAKAA